VFIEVMMMKTSCSHKSMVAEDYFKGFFERSLVYVEDGSMNMQAGACPRYIVLDLPLGR
jgi:hypothetical protein